MADDNIAYVGTLLYTDGIAGNIIMQSKSYVPDKLSGVHTEPVFYEIGPYQRVAYYSLPESTAYYNKNAPFFNESRDILTYSTNFGDRTMYVLRNDPRGLPTSISGSYNYATTKAVIESDEFIEGVVEDLKSSMGESSLNAAVKRANAFAYEKAKVYAYEIGDPNAAIARLYPDSDNSLVQWAVVATPLAVNTANNGNDIGFWITRDNTTNAYFPSLDVITTADYGTISFAMDAYAQATYNGITHNMFASEDYRLALKDYGIPLSYLESGTGGVNSGTSVQSSTYKNWGLLKKEYGNNNFNKLADIAYIDSERWPEHCLGLESPKNISGDWHDSADTYGRYGGITIAFSNEPEDTSIPVYYYITPDPNDPILPPGSATPPTFKPEPPEGTTVKKVVIPDKPLPNTSSENPPQDFPDDQPAVPKNPDGSYPIEPDDPPYILVECEQTEIPVYFHTFTFTNTDTSKQYKDVFEYLKDNKGIDESSATETIVCKETLPTLAANKTAQYTPNAEYADGGVIVEALSTSTTAGNDRWSPMITNMSSQLSCNTSINYDHVPKGMLLINPAKEPLGNQSVEYYGKIDPKSATRSIHVKVYALADSEPIEGPERDTDRIKTYDVTQYIVIDDSSTSHINSFSSYANTDYNSYNQSTMPASNSTHNKTNGAWIYSKGSLSPFNDSVKAINYFNTYACRFNFTHSHEYKETVPPTYDEEGNVKVPAHEETKTRIMSCGFSCSATIHNCKYLKEIPTVVYGKVSPAVIQKSTTRDNKTVITNNGWKQPTSTANPVPWGDVGFTVPQDYYAYKDVVKLSGSKTFSSGSQYFLPDTSRQIVSANGLTASKYAVFDVLFGMNGSSDDYWIQYLDSSRNLIGSDGHMQYAQFTDTDKSADWQSSIGDGEFSFKDSGTTINQAQFIAHRDLLSGDEVATSLAVSGYMAKYASNAKTSDYLKLMKNAGFVFKGLANAGVATGTQLKYVNTEINTIGHENRTIWISNSSSTTALAASSSGSAKNSYNTNYTHGGSDQYKVRFGLGGTGADGADVFNIIADTNINDCSVNTSSSYGDVSRSIWYFADYTTGKAADGHGPTSYTAKADHASHVVCGEHSATCGGHIHGGDPAVAVAHDNDVNSAISGNKYVLVAPDIFINSMNRTMTHTSTNISGGSQTGAIDRIDTSRLFVTVPLAVEGTTAGLFDPEGKDGLAYNTGLLKLDSGVLTYKPSTELSGAEQKSQKSYEENTFEIKNADYSTLGSSTREDKLLAEYRYTVPTRSYVFNPSYYMRFDDDFVDNNKSVWMLSNQPREINFKNIFSIRLVQPLAGSGNTEAGAKGGYPTIVDSAWSTDKEDINTQTVTGLPVLKAGNSYKAETATTEGTITAYVVLQDPEFTGNPNDSQMNEKILQEYNAEMQNILKEMGAVVEPNALAAYTSRTNTDNKKLGFAMYTNMTNGSSTNSRFQIHGSNELRQKEPMVITHSTVSAKVTTGKGDFTSTGKTDLSNWEFYALQGNKVCPIMKNDASDDGSIGFEGKDTDISDTTSAGNRKFLDVTVKSQSDAQGFIANTLSEINGRLTGIMANGQNGKGLAYPSSTSPYLTGDKDFSWYTEDYEGFVVAVYSISFKIEGDGTDINGKKDNNAGIVTDFSAAYRHESDWRQPTNALADAEKGHALKTPVSYTSGLNVDNIYAHSSNITVNKDGTLVLLTEKTKDHDSAETILKDWSANLKKDYGQEYTAAIYGIGLELTNVPIHFGSTVENQQSTSDYCKNVIGSDSDRRSFFYQPTYFNVRGSVYDTTH